ncbi:MAG: hypothetical protein IIA89_08170 [Chloroflexi bacterium]|nr:hypothetical protein [Chloroflexota bacterium]
MAQLYYRMNLHEKTVRFDHFFRDYPDYGEHQAGYCVNAGLADLMDWMQETHVSEADIERLDAGVLRLVNPHVYHVSLSEELWRLKPDLIRRARGSGD